MAQAIYIYGIINSNEEKKYGPVEKTNSGEVYTISYQDIACVVSKYPKSSFDYGTREEVAKKLVTHQSVIEKVMKEHTIIPIKFGTLLENGDEVRKVLEKSYSEFKDKLKKIDRKIELDIVAVWNDLNSVIKKIAEEDEEIRKFKEEIAKKSFEDTFQDRIKIGSMVKDALDKKRDELQSEMLEILKDKIKVNEPKKHDLMDDKMIFSCAFLLDKEKENEFDRALNELNESYNETVNFRCVGPLPLYSFSTYEVKKVDFEGINKARKLLGLSDEVDALDIKTAYRKLVREKHPDKFPNNIDAQKKFEEIQVAYKMVLDYCQAEKKSLKKEDIQGAFMIGIFDIEGEMQNAR